MRAGVQAIPQSDRFCYSVWVAGDMLQAVMLPLRRVARPRQVSHFPRIFPQGHFSHLRFCKFSSEVGEPEDQKKFGADRVWMGKNMTKKFVSAGSRRPVPYPTAARLELSDSLTAAGANPADIARGLVRHFGTEVRAGAKFSDIDSAGFCALLAEACPEQSSHACAVFDVLSPGPCLEAEDLLALLRAGMPMDAPEFEQMVWEEKFETIGKLDMDHTAIFDLMNIVSSTVREGTILDVRSSMAKVREHSEPHFAMEIAMLKKCSTYEDWVCDYHEEIHNVFIDQIATFEKDLGAQKASAICDLASGYSIAFMKEWMLYHMVWVDQPCVYHLEQAGLA